MNDAHSTEPSNTARPSPDASCKGVMQAFNVDCKRHTKEVGAKLQTLMAEGNICGAHMEVGHWWKDYGSRAQTPNREDLPKVSNDFQMLHTASPPTGDPIPTLVPPAPVDDSIPSEDKIATTIFRLKNSKASRPSRTKAKHIKEWHLEKYLVPVPGSTKISKSYPDN